MTHEHETKLLELKDRLLGTLHRVDGLLSGEEDDSLDIDELLDVLGDAGDDPDEQVTDGVVDPGDAGRKREKPIEYNLRPRRGDVAFKEHA